MNSTPPGGALPRARQGSRLDWIGWSTPSMWAGIVLAVGVLYWPSTGSLLVEWFETPSSAYRHGPLVVLIAMLLAVRDIRAQGGRSMPGPRSGLWFTLLVLLSFAWLIALRAGIQVVHQALLPLIAGVAVRATLGARIARLSAVPLALMYSAIPVWHVAVPVLQAMTVSVVGALLRIVGIPAFVDGDFVTIRSGVFHVEDGCAGLHYFIVAVTLAGLYGELRADTWRVRAGLVALAVGLALLSNWLRVFIIIVAGYVTDMQSYLVRVDHAAFGWLVFAVAMIAFLLLARLWAAREPTPRESVAAVLPRASLQIAPVMLLAAAVGPAWMLWMPVRPAASANVTLPDSIAGWDGPHQDCRTRWQPRFEAADRVARRGYVRGDQAVCAYVATFLEQHQDKELIGYWSAVYPPGSEVVAQAARESAGHHLNEVQLGDPRNADLIVWYSYVVGGREMRRGVAAQLGYGMGTLLGAPASSVFAIGAQCLPDCGAARRTLGEFLPNIRVGE